MHQKADLSISMRDKILFTPGPLTTSSGVKEAMLHDYGSRDKHFINIVSEIRDKLVELGGATTDKYAAILMQGSGTFALEAACGSLIPAGGKLLVVINGAYGRRMTRIARILGIETVTIEYPEDHKIDAADVAQYLANDPAVTHVSFCHCETTSGIFNPLREVCQVIRESGRLSIVDAMSTFGAVPINFGSDHIDYLISSANKCIEGVPGFAYVIARLDPFLKTAGYSRSLVLDLYDQYRGFEINGQFRFTPPTHSLLAFRQALSELEAEGGTYGREKRYSANRDELIKELTKAGFRLYLDQADQGWVITSICSPTSPQWDFHEFYKKLNDEGYVIYPGKVGNADCFRVGTCGRIAPPDIRALLGAMKNILEEMKVKL